MTPKGGDEEFEDEGEDEGDDGDAADERSGKSR